MAAIAAVAISAISGWFGSRSAKKKAKKEAAARALAEQNQVYMLALQRKWELQDRRYKQDAFATFEQFAPNSTFERGPLIDPESITPVDPYAAGARSGGVTMRDGGIGTQQPAPAPASAAVPPEQGKAMAAGMPAPGEAKTYTGPGSTSGAPWAGSGNSNPAGGYGYTGTNWGSYSPNPSPSAGSSSWGSAAGSAATAVISGYFESRAASATQREQIKSDKLSQQNAVYQQMLQRKWALQNRRYTQDSFANFGKYATPGSNLPTGASTRVDPNSITPVNPYAPAPKTGGSANAASLTQAVAIAKPPAPSRNPTGKVAIPGAVPRATTDPAPWRTVA